MNKQVLSEDFWDQTTVNDNSFCWRNSVYEFSTFESSSFVNWIAITMYKKSNDDEFVGDNVEDNKTGDDEYDCFKNVDDG